MSGKVIQKIHFGHFKNVQNRKGAKESWEKLFYCIIEFYGLDTKKIIHFLLR
jgi:hypothetical protein